MENPLNIPQTRTGQQNRALHLFFETLAEELNTAGVDMKLILKGLPVNIPATKTNIKEDIWKPIQWAMFNKKSTTQLEKGEIDKIYDTIVRHFGDMGMEVPRFPSLEDLLDYEEIAGKVEM